MYLYGAAVQGIQGFIFQTNRLREIVGASELVERICTGLFAQVLDAAKKAVNPSGEIKKLENDENAILNAAGNIKYIFTNEDVCRKVVRIFPKTVMEFAPGITISQSVVRFDPEDNEGFGKAVQTLETNLRTQRNRLMRDLSLGLMGILRSREAGLPVTHIKEYKEKTEYLDSATYHKLYDDKGERKETFNVLCRKAFGDAIDSDGLYEQHRLPIDIKDMTRHNDWVAIIHADGNGLGQIVQKIGKDKDKFKEFSKLLDEATMLAAQRAFQIVVTEDLSKYETIPMRPIVLSGDDHTVICRGDIAIPYTKAFLEFFEDETWKKLDGMLLEGDGEPVFKDSSDRLTACAGIAFVKSSFPFHFGYQLAEALCDRAKKDTKAIFNAGIGNLPASCLMFHKVQDSFVVDYRDIVARELTPQPDISFEFGPYYIKDVPQEKGKRWNIKELLESGSLLNKEEGNAVKSGLRNWLTLLHENPGMAEQKLARMQAITIDIELKEMIRNVTKTSVRTLTIETADPGKPMTVSVYPVYDILAVNSITNQTTKIKE